MHCFLMFPKEYISPTPNPTQPNPTQPGEAGARWRWWPVFTPSTWCGWCGRWPGGCSSQTAFSATISALSWSQCLKPQWNLHRHTQIYVRDVRRIRTVTQDAHEKGLSVYMEPGFEFWQQVMACNWWRAGHMTTILSSDWCRWWAACPAPTRSWGRGWSSPPLGRSTSTSPNTNSLRRKVTLTQWNHFKDHC